MHYNDYMASKKNANQKQEVRNDNKTVNDNLKIRRRLAHAFRKVQTN